MPRLVVNADDFGRSAAINQGIVDSHLNGIVTSASLMTRREGFADAVALAKATPSLGIGLHLDLDHFFNVEHGVGRLLSYKDASLPLSAIAQETEDQLKAIVATGLEIGHVDGHHHVHLRPELFAMVAALTAKYHIKTIRYFSGFYKGLYPGVPVDWIKDLVSRFGLHSPAVFFAGWEPVESSLPGYEYWDTAVPFETGELMVHPGRGEPWRERELAHCQSSAVKADLEKRHITLSRFNDLI